MAQLCVLHAEPWSVPAKQDGIRGRLVQTSPLPKKANTLSPLAMW